MTTESPSTSPPVRAARAALRGWRYLYGENPLHLLAMIGCFALSGYVVSLLWTEPSLPLLAVWFGGAVIGHDLVLYPVYAFADQPLTILRWGRRRVLPRHPPLVPAINHVRVPVLGSAVLGLVWFPSITARGAEAFAFTAGHPMLGQYDNWLLITGALFTGSAVIYALRLGVAAGRRVTDLVRHRATDPDPPEDSPPEDSPSETPATEVATEAFVAPTTPFALSGGSANGQSTNGQSTNGASESGASAPSSEPGPAAPASSAAGSGTEQDEVVEASEGPEAPEDPATDRSG